MAMNLNDIENLIKEALPDAKVDIQDLANHLADRLGSPIDAADIKRFKILDISNEIN